MGKEKCKCGKVAVWMYMPSDGLYCDDCISSKDDIGCSCNFNYAKGIDFEGNDVELPEGVEGKDWRWVIADGSNHLGVVTKEDGIWQRLDERGRPYPCVEYWYDEEGFDKPTIIDSISYYFDRGKRNFKRWWKRHIIDDAPTDQTI